MTFTPSDSRRLSLWVDTHVAIVCECGRRDTHRIADLRKSMPATTAIDALHRILTAMCPRAAYKPPDALRVVGDECQAVLVSPDDGVAVDG